MKVNIKKEKHIIKKERKNFKKHKLENERFRILTKWD